ncbi:MAG: competence/damage-inducible protein A [Verrucomicrobiales bacterium]
MRLEVINTGTELLLGEVVNTHAAYFGQQLFACGLRVQRQVTIPDGEVIGEALREAFPRCDALLITGGLGPTPDDITREVIAAMLDLPLEEDGSILDHIRGFLSQRKAEVNADNRRQAMLPRGAKILTNPHGTAPGLYVPDGVGGAHPHLFLMPGPPRELKPMFEGQVLPALKSLAGHELDQRPCKILRIYGVGESTISNRLFDLNAMPGLELGYCLSGGSVNVRLIGENAAVEQAAQSVRGAFGSAVVSEDGASMEQIVVGLLKDRGATAATAESCTGGLIANRLTDVPGASAVFGRGFVTYSNEAKAELLGVPKSDLENHGAVSEPVARAMAEGALKAARADFAVAVTGIAGPTGGTPDKPVGTVFIAAAKKGGATAVEKAFYPRGRDRFKLLTSEAALNLLRLQILGSPSAGLGIDAAPQLASSAATRRSCSAARAAQMPPRGRPVRRRIRSASRLGGLRSTPSRRAETSRRSTRCASRWRPRPPASRWLRPAPGRRAPHGPDRR